MTTADRQHEIVPGLDPDEAAGLTTRELADRIDEWIDLLFDDLPDPALGWRYFTVDPDTGHLRSPFGWDRSRKFPRDWARAVCSPDTMPLSFRRYSNLAFDDQPHDVPGDRCGCGWRVYPSVTAARAGAGVWPVDQRDQSAWALVRVEYGGGLATRPEAIQRRSDDEAGTVRAEWLRVVGPAYLPASTTRPARRGLGRRYGLPTGRIITLDQGVLDALAAGAIVDEEDRP